MSEELSNDQKEAVRDKLEFSMAMQRATQEINQHWEDRISKLKDLHSHELQNLTDGQRTYSKPKLLDRLRGRYRDHYILFNNKVPIFCHKEGCDSRRKGVNFGVESICLTREQALDAAAEYWERMKSFNGYSFHSLSIVHFQVDRFGSQKGVIVRNITLDQKDWNEEVRSQTKKELSKVTADKLVLDSLMSMRPRRKK